MIRILMVCHGNICRSVAAEMVLKHLVRSSGLSGRIAIDSAAVSSEELGNDIYPPMKQALTRAGFPVERHRARQITRADYTRYDLIIGMDDSNLRRMRNAFGGDPDKKLSYLLDHCGRAGREIDDPWYTRDFDGALRQIVDGCRGLLEEIAPCEGGILP